MMNRHGTVREDGPAQPRGPACGAVADTARRRPAVLFLLILHHSALIALPDTHYVSLNGEHISPYTNWATAANFIQAAIDATEDGDTVLVSNGVYQVGVAVTAGGARRAAITNAIVLESVNGPDVTFILGSGTNDGSFVTCAYVSSNAMLQGFTLTNGYAWGGGIGGSHLGGGVFCEDGALVSNCVITGCSSVNNGGGIYADDRTPGLLRKTRITDCTVVGNWTSEASGGGASGVLLERCILAGNEAYAEGGAAYECILVGCLVVSNRAEMGGGISQCQAYSSLISRNNALIDVGGVLDSMVWNSTIVGNNAGDITGGADADLFNCIIYYNTDSQGEPNVYAGPGVTISHCCTTPDPGGVENITNAPLFVDLEAGQHALRPESPSVDAGESRMWMDSAVDLDGKPRVFNVVDMGAYEFTMTTELKTFLEGPYQTSTHAMTALLVDNDLVPPASPYCADSVGADAIPSNATDWVVLELLDTDSHKLVSVKSGCLRQDGTLVNEEGEPGVRLEASPGHYYLVAKHRNHVAVMSAQPIAYTNELVTYDFTTASSQAYGGTNSLVEVEPGVWAMIAGDADGDGRVTETDRAIVEQQMGLSGYLVGDLNLDGVVTDEDE